MFKVGDKVRIRKNYAFAGYRDGDIGEVTGVEDGYISFNNSNGWATERFELVTQTIEERSDKETVVRFILQYELDTDPFETFATRTAVEDRIKELAKRSDLKRDSIKVYEVAKTFEVKLETKLLWGTKAVMSEVALAKPKRGRRKKYTTEEERRAAHRRASNKWYRKNRKVKK